MATKRDIERLQDRIDVMQCQALNRLMTAARARKLADLTDRTRYEEWVGAENVLRNMCLEVLGIPEDDVQNAIRWAVIYAEGDALRQAHVPVPATINGRWTDFAVTH